MTNPSIFKIAILPLGMLNAYLIVDEGAAILVDTGLPKSEAKISNALERFGLGWDSIKLIVLTHAHIDHAGSAVTVQRRTGAIEQPFDYFTPDLEMTEGAMALSSFGIAGTLLHTPGHTPGSLSLLLDNGQVIAGDLAASGLLLGGLALKDRPKSPPFEEDRALVARSLEYLLDRGAQQFHLGHGGPLYAEKVRNHIVKLRSTRSPV